MLTGAAAGLIFGIQDALTRQTLQGLHRFGFPGLLVHWAPYALVGAGALGIWLVQSAFNSGPLNVSLPAISAGEPVVGILLGVVVFGDRIQDTPGELAIYTGGLAALVAGVVMVSRSPALSQLRAWTEENIPSLPPLPHVPVHVPRLPLDLPGLHGSRADDNGDLPDGAAAEETTHQELPPPVDGAIAPRRRRFRRQPGPVSDLRGLPRSSPHTRPPASPRQPHAQAAAGPQRPTPANLNPVSVCWRGR
jgi:hypothetical protein